MTNKKHKTSQNELERIRAALIEGEKSGVAQPFDYAKFIKEMKKSSHLK